MSIVGQCWSMCPESEMDEHDSGYISPFESNSHGKFDPKMAIKKYHRSEASKEMKPEEVRPLPILQNTIKHILDVVIGKILNSRAHTSELDLYNYLADRLRAINQDISTQGLRGEEVIEILETNVLFFVWAGSKFHNVPIDSFDLVSNRERLTKTIGQLEEMYDLLGYPAKNVAFFRALFVLTYINQDQFISKVMPLPDSIMQSSYIQQVLRLRSAIVKNNPTLFLEALEAMPVQLAAYAVQNCRQMWSRVGSMMRQGLGSRQFGRNLIEILQLSGTDLVTWLKVFQIREGDNCMEHVQGAPVRLEDLPHVIGPNGLFTHNTVSNFLEFIQIPEGSTADVPVFRTPSLPTPVRIPEPVHIPEPEPEPAVIPIIPEPEPEPEPILDQKAEPSSVPEQTQLAIPVPEPEPEVVPKPKPRIVLKPKIIPNRPVTLMTSTEISAMIPTKIPELACATILVRNDDDSESANFARRRLGSVPSGLLFCEVFSCRRSEIFVLLTTDVDHPGINVIFDCNETDEIDSSVPVVSFRTNSGCSDALAFNASLRKAIRKAVTEMTAIDISLLVSKCISIVHQRMSKPVWRWATANAVIDTLNQTIRSFCDLLGSKSFANFLLPFEHGLLDAQDFEKFCDELRAAQMDRLKASRSNQCLNGSSWPIFIRKNVELSCRSFVVPMSTLFNENEFIEAVLSNVELTEPKETIRIEARSGRGSVVADMRLIVV